MQRINFAFVAGRWASPFWQTWDLLQLWLAQLHGTNGLRVIINDYAERDGTRFWLKMLLYTRVVPRARPRHARDLHLRPEHHAEERRHAIQFHRYDTIIVGAGGAGMRAALEAGKRSRTAVLTKLYPTRSHTGAAQGGMCAALANVEEDNWEWHTFDTVKGGDYLVDQDAAEVMCKEAIDAVLDLEKMGLPFNRTPEGRIDQRRFGGHTRNHGEAAVRRSCFAADRTGHMILQTLYQQCVKDEHRLLQRVLRPRPAAHRGRRRAASPPASSPTSWPPASCTSSRPSRCCSPPAASARSSRSRRNAHTLTGDGMGIVYRKGLPLEDMEFFQFHPTGIWKMGILLTEGARGEGGILRNKDGERFMERYAPTIKDLAPRDMVARAIYTEIRQGRGCGPDGDHVFLDLTHLPPEQLDAKLPDITEFARTYLGIEPYTDPIPIQPTAHYAMGGVPTNIDAQVLRNNTDVVRACSPPARSPASRCTAPTASAPTRCSTSTSSAGAAASSAAAYANSVDFVDLPPKPGGRHARRCCSGCATAAAPSWSPRSAPTLQETMDANASVYRTEATLKQAEVDIAALKERYLRVGVADRGKRYNTELLEAVELGFLLDLAEVPGRVGARRATSRAAGTSARTTRPATTSTSCATRWRTRSDAGLPVRGPARLQAGRADPLPADGAQVLMTVDRGAPAEPAVAGRSDRPAHGHAEDPPLRPRGRPGGQLAELRGAGREGRPPARRPAPDQVVPGRLADLPPLLRARRLRLRRHAHQRRQPAGLQGAGQGPRRRRSSSSRSRACRS